VRGLHGQGKTKPSDPFQPPSYHETETESNAKTELVLSIRRESKGIVENGSIDEGLRANLTVFEWKALLSKQLSRMSKQMNTFLLATTVWWRI
jgi:hypothetical protein